MLKIYYSIHLWYDLVQILTFELHNEIEQIVKEFVLEVCALAMLNRIPGKNLRYEVDSIRSQVSERNSRSERKSENSSSSRNLNMGVDIPTPNDPPDDTNMVDQHQEIYT